MEEKNYISNFAHTNLAASVANKTILETLNERLPEAEIVKLDELYPDFKIDVEMCIRDRTEGKHP